jgi:hypothetical protein
LAGLESLALDELDDDEESEEEGDDGSDFEEESEDVDAAFESPPDASLFSLFFFELSWASFSRARFFVP